MENAFNLYAVNKSRMLRYASRRKVKEEVLSIIEQQSGKISNRLQLSPQTSTYIGFGAFYES